MSEMRFTEDHEWIRVEGDGTGTCGITNYAQDQLGELVYIELPEVGQEIEQGADVAVIESVKAAGELKAPVGGTVEAINEALVEEPGTANSDPEGEGWFLRVRIADAAQLEGLMDQGAYDAYVAGLD